ncbi:hypothetical protein H8959_006753 [Pygathrix nigripes]
MGEVLNTLIHHNEAVLHLRFSSGLMVTCSKDRSIAVWDRASATDITLRRVLYRDGLVVSGSSDNTIRLSDIECGSCLRVLEGHEESVAEALSYRAMEQSLEQITISPLLKR